MKILFLDPNKNAYNYYVEIIFYLSLKYKENFKVYPKYQNKTISEIIKDMGWIPDIIIVGFSHTNTGNRKPIKIVNDTNYKLYIILNKEYAALEKKLQFIRESKPYKCFTVHHEAELYEKKTKIPFQRIMWSADPKIFKDYFENYEYDLYFSGVVRPEQTENWREKIFEFLKTNNDMKTYNIFLNNLSNGGKRISNVDYAKQLSKSKICFITTGPADLIGTRFFEVMATNRCMILCNYVDNPNIYDKYLIDGFNCVMFNSISDFHKKIIFYFQNDNKRMEIVNKAFEYFNKELTWEKNIEKISFL